MILICMARLVFLECSIERDEAFAELSGAAFQSKLGEDRCREEA